MEPPLLDEAYALISHNIEPAVGWYRSADAAGEKFDRERLHDRYRRAARDVLALSSPPPVSGTATRDDVARVIREVARGLSPTEDRAANRLHDLADQLELPPLLALGGSQPAGLPDARDDRDDLAAVLAPAVDDVFASRGYPLTDGDAQFAARYLADKVLRDWKPEEEA